MQRAKKPRADRQQRSSQAHQQGKECPRALLYWRSKHGYTLSDLAARTLLSAATLCRIELGGPVSMRVRVRLMDQLKLNMEELEELLKPAKLEGTRTSREELALRPEQLRKRRERLGLNIRELAARAGVNIATIYRAERGPERVHASTRVRIGMALDRLEGK